MDLASVVIQQSLNSLLQQFCKMMCKVIILVATVCALTASALPFEDYYGQEPQEFDVEDTYSPQELYEMHRVRRSLQPGAPNVPIPGQPDKKTPGWSVNPTAGRDDKGNTNTNIDVTHTGANHDFNAGWGKVIRGPGKAKPTWHVGGTYRW